MVQRLFNVVTSPQLSLSDAGVASLGSALEALYAQTVIGSLSFTSTVPKTWDFKITMGDGRVWHQVLSYTNSINDLVMAYSQVSGVWAAAEVDLIRAIRAGLVAILNRVTVSRITCSFN